MEKTIRQAILAVPVDTPRRPHGRDIATGIDCWGFVMHVYREVGLPFDDLDVPYSERDAWRPTRCKVLTARLDKKFERLRFDGTWQAGDIWIVGDGGRSHPGIVSGDHFWDFRERLRRTVARRIAPLVVEAWRHRNLA